MNLFPSLDNSIIYLSFCVFELIKDHPLRIKDARSEWKEIYNNYLLSFLAFSFCIVFHWLRRVYIKTNEKWCDKIKFNKLFVVDREANLMQSYLYYVLYGIVGIVYTITLYIVIPYCPKIVYFILFVFRLFHSTLFLYFLLFLFVQFYAN